MTIELIQNQIQAEIKKETGSDVEVTIIKGAVMVYTEDLTNVDLIKDLMGKVRMLVKETNYEADEDFPAALTLTYSL